MENTDEYNLVKALQGGEIEAFDELYNKHFDPIFKYVWSKTSDKEIAKELAQDVFVRALESISQFQPERSFGAWLSGIAKNLLHEYWRKKRNWKNHANKFLDDYLDDDTLFEDVENKIDTEKIIAITLSDLTELQKKIFIMRILEQKQTPEVAILIYGEDNDANRRKVSSNLTRAIKIATEHANSLKSQ